MATSWSPGRSARFPTRPAATSIPVTRRRVADPSSSRRSIMAESPPTRQPEPRKRANAPGAVKRDLRRLASELAHAFANRRNLPELIRFIVATFRELLGAEGVAILLLDREHDELFFPFSAEENPQVAERLSRIRFPADRGIAGKVVRTGRSLRIDDTFADRWFFAGVDEETQRVTRSLLCAPLISVDGTSGVIEAVNPSGREHFNDDDLALLDALGQTIARAIENARQHAPAAAGAEHLKL